MSATCYRIWHDTRYRYTQPVARARHWLHLQPRPVPWQSWLDWQLQIVPDAEISHGTDAWGNPSCWLVMEQWHDELEVSMRGLCKVQGRHWPEKERIRMESMPWEKLIASLESSLEKRHPQWLSNSAYLYQSTHIRLKHVLRRFAQRFFRPGQPVLQALWEMNRSIYEEFQYDPSATDIHTSVLHVLQEQRGVCQDFAHLMIAALRSLGIPARYMSGYLCTHPPKGQERLRGVDASHAWLAAWTAEYGWLELDPTNGCFAGSQHVLLNWGRDFADVSPLRGILLGGAVEKLGVEVTVEPVP